VADLSPDDQTWFLRLTFERFHALDWVCGGGRSWDDVYAVVEA